MQRLKFPAGSESIRDKFTCWNKKGSLGVVLAQVQRREKPLSHVKVGLHDTALEAPSLLEGAGLEISQERHPPFVFLLLWSRGEDETHSQL